MVIIITFVNLYHYSMQCTTNESHFFVKIPCRHAGGKGRGIGHYTCSFVGFLNIHSLIQFFLSTWSVIWIVVYRNGKREERWEGRPRGRCMVYKVWLYN